MSTRPTWPLTLAFIAAAAGVAALTIHRFRPAEDRAAVFATRARLDAERREAEQKLASAERERTQLEAELTARAKQNARPAERPLGAPPPAPDPEQLAAQARQAEARLALQYAPFYRAAGIDAATAERFGKLLREREAQERDLFEIARGLPPEMRTEVMPSPHGDPMRNERVDPAIAAMRRRLDAQFEADQIAILGEEGFMRLQEFRQNEGRRQIVERFMADLTLTDSPATPEQTRQLSEILASSGLSGKPQLDESSRWREVLSRASGVLSAPQLAALKKQADAAERTAAQAALSKLLKAQQTRP